MSLARGVRQQVSTSPPGGVKREEVADENGMQTMVQNGINPVGMKKLMLHFKLVEAATPGTYSFLSSHPDTDSRIKHADQFAATHKSSSFAPKPVLDSLWLQLKH